MKNLYNFLNFLFNVMFYNKSLIIILVISAFIFNQNISNAQILKEAKTSISEHEKLKKQFVALKSKWQTRGFLGLTFNQNYFSNWAKGGENSYSAIGHLSYDFKYRSDDSSFIWQTNTTLGAGVLYINEFGTRKAEDKIDISSKYGYRAVKNLYYSTMLKFNSQFFKGYNYPNDSVIVSNFLSPAYTILSLGLDYKPTSYLSLYISPCTGKHILVADQELADKGLYGVEPAVYDKKTGEMLEPGKRYLLNFGAYLVAHLDAEVWQNVFAKSKLELFNNYTAKNKRDRDKIIVNFENTIMMKINHYISANLFLHFVYDYQNLVPQYKTVNDEKILIGHSPRLQIKENFGLGFSMNF